MNNFDEGLNATKHIDSNHTSLSSNVIRGFFLEERIRVERYILQKQHRILNIDLEMKSFLQKPNADTTDFTPLQHTLYLLQLDLNQATLEFENTKESKLACLKQRLQRCTLLNDKGGFVRTAYDIEQLKSATQDLKMVRLTSRIKHLQMQLTGHSAPVTTEAHNVNIGELQQEKSRLLVELASLQQTIE